MRQRCQTIPLLFMSALAVGPAVADEKLPDLADLEAQGAIVGNIVLKRDNVFDLSDPAENNWVFRLANRLHIVTREGTIRKQVLLKSGDTVSKRLTEETARILRQNSYLHDATIRPIRVDTGVVDLEVTTRDLWSLGPDISIARSGGENRTRIGLEESNLLGRGQRLQFVRDEDVDRTSIGVEFSDRHLGRSWVSMSLGYADNSDGDSHVISVVRPFYALDTRWSAGGYSYRNDREESLYALGEPAAEYRHERAYDSLFGGWSKGLRNGRARRWTVGVVHDDNRFSTVSIPELPQAVPQDRKLVYPFIGLEIVEDRFETSSNHDQIDRTEDFLMGERIAASLGWADTSFGSDREALIYTASASRGMGKLNEDALFLTASASGRIESGDTVNALFSLSARWYRTQSDKRLLYALLSGTSGHALDLDNLVELGGDTGLRGYPLRYQTGSSKLLFSIEQRYFTDWYLWRIARVGGAIFADAGRVWGTNPVGEPNQGWLSDVGFGLRFALTRSSSRKVIHVDLAFPLGGDSSIDSVQLLLESRASF